MEGPDSACLVGDVAFDEVRERCAFIPPVPGGVGPMTIACLLDNTVTAAEALFAAQCDRPACRPGEQGARSSGVAAA